MRPDNIRRKTALIMAFLLLITTTGFSMNFHFCGGNLQDISFFSGEVDCSMMEQMKNAPDCPMHAQMNDECCDDQDVVLDSDSPETYLVGSLHLHPDWTLTLPVYFAGPSVKSIQALLDAYTTYRPPPIDRDIPVLVQSFLL